MFVNAGILAAGLQSRTYAEFQAHIATLAPTSRPWGFYTDAGAIRTTAATPVGEMDGSPWLQRMDIGGTRLPAPCRIVQHGLPSEAEFYAQIAAGREIFFRLNVNPGGSAAARNRNGFMSTAGSNVFNTDCPELIYWDGAQAQRMRPSLGLGPTPYTW